MLRLLARVLCLLLCCTAILPAAPGQAAPAAPTVSPRRPVWEAPVTEPVAAQTPAAESFQTAPVIPAPTAQVPAANVAAEPAVTPTEPAVTVQAVLPVRAAGQTAGQQPERALTLSLFTKSVNAAARQTVVTVLARNPGQSDVAGVAYGVLTGDNGVPVASATAAFTARPGNTRIILTFACPAGQDAGRLNVYAWNTGMQPLSDPLTADVDLAPTVTELQLNSQNVRLILTKKETFRLTAHTLPADLPDPGVTFTSENTAVATVDATGLITPVKAGTADVVAVTKDRTAWAVCRVTVISDVTRVTLNAAACGLETAGSKKTFQLKATVTPADAPDKTLTFTSSNTKVATVDAKGLITAQGAGTANVTVATGDGAASAVCKVTVTASPTAVKLNQTKLVMWDYGSYTLKATVTGGSGKQTVTWRSADDTIATVTSSGIVYAMAKGATTITAEAGGVKATCKVNVYREYDYTGTIAARFESGDDPGCIGGSGTGKSYGCFMLYAGVGAPQAFYNWLISNGFNAAFGTRLKKAHQADGGNKTSYGAAFDKEWKALAAEDREEFRSCQMAYCMSLFYEPLVNRLVTELNFYPDNYGLALKSALWSRAIQHGNYGAFNRIKEAYNALGGFDGKTEKQIIDAIYAQSGAVVSTPPGDHSIPMDSSSSIAVKNGLVGKYMKFFANNSSSVQAAVWQRLHVTEPKLLYDLMENPPVVITK